MLNRRDFLRSLAGGAGLALVAATPWAFLNFKKNSKLKSLLSSFDHISGQLLGPNFKQGHRLRSLVMQQKVDEEREIPFLILGGGIAGLTAAWELNKKNKSFELLELEDHVGGNSYGSQNKISAYPWGAHYVPLPNKDNKDLINFLYELGVVSSFSSEGIPLYNPEYLCHDPEERLFFQGRWHEALIPTGNLVAPHEEKQILRFLSEIESFKNKKGRDGLYYFEIPIAKSSRDKEALALDEISFLTWLQNNHYDSKILFWYLNYCCRDDYGIVLEKTSAWAGLHYFAARRPWSKKDNAEHADLLTWPEGNHWIVKELEKKLSSKIKKSHMVYKVEVNADFVDVWVLDLNLEKSIRYRCEQAILAMPRFVAGHVVKGLAPTTMNYAPWLTANLTVGDFDTGEGASLSWDNVSYYSSSLGYVNANHQDIKPRSVAKRVLTYYHPLSHLPPKEAREWAQSRSHREWVDWIMNDLESIHPDMGRHVENIDVWIWGHAMACPEPGIIWKEALKERLPGLKRLHFAHSDMSGVSLFEEAFYHGVSAARKLMV